MTMIWQNLSRSQFFKMYASLLDFFRNSIWSLKLCFLASLLQNFSTRCVHMLSKFCNKSAQKSQILSTKASFKRSLLICLFLGFPYETSCKSTVVNIIADDNGVGLSRDMRILEKELQEMGYSVNLIKASSDISKLPVSIPKAQYNIFIEHNFPSLFKYAKKNYFLPNPEWYLSKLSTLSGIDLILCRTKEVQRIFSAFDVNTYYMGFTSLDRLDSTIDKEYDKILHLQGKSISKGTSKVIFTWKHNIDNPMLHLVGENISPSTSASSYANIHYYPKRLSEKELIHLTNSCGIHLCPSETEGFGHYIVEAMSASAVVVTTDAPPMNEFITDQRCLVKYYKTKIQNLATTYHADPLDLQRVLENLLQLPKSELEEIGRQNRRNYLVRKDAFEKQIRALFDPTAPPLQYGERIKSEGNPKDDSKKTSSKKPLNKLNGIFKKFSG